MWDILSLVVNDVRVVCFCGVGFMFGEGIVDF